MSVTGVGECGPSSHLEPCQSASYSTSPETSQPGLFKRPSDLTESRGGGGGGGLGLAAVSPRTLEKKIPIATPR